MAKNDEHGNSMAATAAYVRTLVRQAETLLSFENVWQAYFDEDVTLDQMRVIFPGIVGGEYRIVIKATMGGQKFVAFHNAATLVEALVGVINRLENKSIRFKEDQYAE